MQLWLDQLGFWQKNQIQGDQYTIPGQTNPCMMKARQRQSNAYWAPSQDKVGKGCDFSCSEMYPNWQSGSPPTCGPKKGPLTVDIREPWAQLPGRSDPAHGANHTFGQALQPLSVLGRDGVPVSTQKQRPLSRGLAREGAQGLVPTLRTAWNIRLFNFPTTRTRKGSGEMTY